MIMKHLLLLSLLSAISFAQSEGFTCPCDYPHCSGSGDCIIEDCYDPSIGRETCSTWEPNVNYIRGFDKSYTATTCYGSLPVCDSDGYCIAEECRDGSCADAWKPNENYAQLITNGETNDCKRDFVICGKHHVGSCIFTDGKTANPSACICGRSDCTALTGLFCKSSSSQCSKTAYVPLPEFCVLKSPTSCHGTWHEMEELKGSANPFNNSTNRKICDWFDPNLDLNTTTCVALGPIPAAWKNSYTGLIDIIVGNTEGKIEYYENTGSLTNPMFTERNGTANPFNWIDLSNNKMIDVGFGNIAAGVYTSPLSWKNSFTGLMDLVVGTHDGKIKYYKNTGSLTNSKFTEQNGTANPFSGIHVQRYASPESWKNGNTGLMDLIVGETFGNIKYYKNTGSLINPKFTEQTGTSNPFNDIVAGVTPVPVAWENSNGLMDLIVGNEDGKIKYYKNTGSLINPTFTEQTGTSNPFHGIDVENPESFGVALRAAAPLAWKNSNGLMDLIIGNRDGIIKYYKQTDSLTNPKCTKQTGAANPFNSIDVGVQASPFSWKNSHTGLMDVVIVNVSGSFRYYINIGNLTNSTFTEQTGTDNPFNNISVKKLPEKRCSIFSYINIIKWI